MTYKEWKEENNYHRQSFNEYLKNNRSSCLDCISYKGLRCMGNSEKNYRVSKKGICKDFMVLPF